MSKLQYTFKTDTLFKMLFVIRNEEMPPEALGDKIYRINGML